MGKEGRATRIPRETDIILPSLDDGLVMRSLPVHKLIEEKEFDFRYISEGPVETANWKYPARAFGCRLFKI